MEVIADLAQRLQLKAGIPLGAAQRGHEGFGGRMAGAAGEGRDTGIDVATARLDGLDLALRRQARRGVAVQVDRHLDRLDQRADQIIGGVRRQQAGHVLDGDGIGPHLDQLARLLDVHLQRMHRAHGVADGALGVLAGLLDRAHGGFHVAQIIQGIEDTEDIDATCRGALDEGLHHIIGVVTIAEQVLAAQQHLQRGVGHGFLERLQTRPGVFLQKTHAGIEGRAAPHFETVETGLIEARGNRQHVLGAHAGRDQ